MHDHLKDIHIELSGIYFQVNMHRNGLYYACCFWMVMKIYFRRSKFMKLKVLKYLKSPSGMKTKYAVLFCSGIHQC